jgi:cation transport ATPase
MSRSWERMVKKNTKSINKQRKKTGKTGITDSEQPLVIKGRSWLLPIFFLMIAVFLLMTGASSTESAGMHWFTLISYVVVAVVFYLWRRPYLKVFRNQLGTRKWTGEKYIAASDIEKITLASGYAVIQTKGKSKSYVFTKMANLYNMTELGDALREFARLNQVSVYEQANEKGKS